MIEMSIKNISLVVLWIATGAICAVIFMQSIKASITKLASGQKPSAALFIILGAGLRWLVTGALLLLAVRMHIAYALSMFFSFLVVRLFLIYKLHLESKREQAVVVDG